MEEVHNLEVSPVKILTKTAIKKVNDWVSLYVKDNGQIKIFFWQKQFSIDHCGSYAFKNLPEDLNKEWTISKTKEALTILCNGVEALNLVYADNANTRCKIMWSRDTTQVTFRHDDRASDYYRDPLEEGEECSQQVFKSAGLMQLHTHYMCLNTDDHLL